MRSRLRRCLVGAVAAAVAFSTAGAAPAIAHPKKDDHVSKIVKAVSGKNVKKHLKHFEKIAKRHGNTRVSGTRGYDESRDYVAKKLRAAGYKVTIQPFEFLFEGYRTPPVLKRTAPEEKTYSYGFFSDYVAMGDSPAGEVSGQIQAV